MIINKWKSVIKNVTEHWKYSNDYNQTFRKALVWHKPISGAEASVL